VVGWPRDKRLDFWARPLGTVDNITDRFVKKDGDEGNGFSYTHRAKIRFGPNSNVIGFCLNLMKFGLNHSEEISKKKLKF
jgi:hypothetical protein